MDIEERFAALENRIAALEADKEKRKVFKSPTLEKAQEYADQKQLKKFDVEKWWMARETTGWILKSGSKIKSWQMDMLKNYREGYYAYTGGIGGSTENDRRASAVSTETSRRNAFVYKTDG